MTDPAKAYAAIHDAVETVLVGNEELVRQLTVAMLVDGHVLIEGVPGVAKTTAARSFARAAGLAATRIQMTPDIMPADITGTHVYREPTGEFDLQKGPVFANVVLADEINRATPKTQSALLEAMQEGTVTIEGETLGLPDPFMVVATQNPIEYEGTFELPEAQRDRFLFKLTVDRPDRAGERAILDRFDEAPELTVDSVDPQLDAATIRDLRSQVADVHVAPPVKEYVLDLMDATRTHQAVELGASPRAALSLQQASKAHAAIDGRSYVVPDDVKGLLEPLLVHRLVLKTEAALGEQRTDDVVADVLETVPSPSGTMAKGVAAEDA